MNINKVLYRAYISFGLLCFVAFFIRVFFYIPFEWVPTLSVVAQTSMALLLVTEFLRLFFCKSLRQHIHEQRFELSVVFLVIVYFTSFFIDLNFLPLSFQQAIENRVPDITLGFLGITSLLVIISASIDFFRHLKHVMEFQLSTNMIFVLSFFSAIVIGAILLKLPRSTLHPIEWTDAFFIATSAVCVTGLTTLSLADSFTTVGQTVIMLLFQIGGLGIMTLTMMFASLFTGGLALGEFVMLKKIFDTKNASEAKKIFQRISILTFSFEIIGFWILLNARLYAGADLSLNLVFECVFHAISAFCNAGFSVFNQSLGALQVSGLSTYIATIMCLIIFGGLGFPVLINLWHYLTRIGRRQGRRVRLTTHSKLILSSTAILLIAGTLLIYLSERSQSFVNLSFGQQVWQSLFLSVTSRTAGFNLWPTEALGTGTLAFIMLLMWIGGAPISTAGGIKCSTFAVALVQVYNQLRAKARCEIFEREISLITIQRAFTVIFGSVLIVFVAFISLLNLNPQLDAQDLLFEAFSAWGTVGLSRGITSSLTDGSKLIIMLLMFCGRVGFFTVFAIFVKNHVEARHRYLEDHITVY